MTKIKVGINGFGRIGRAFLKVAWDKPEIEIVAVNDLGSVENMAYLLKYDTVYKKWEHPVRAESSNGTGDNYIVIDENRKVKVLAEKEPSKLPWGDLGVDVVVESTGFFTSYEKAYAHIQAGAKKVVISAPGKDGDGTILGETILLGINEEKFGTCDITSNASCTTNAASPLIAILDESLGIEKAILNTVHGYTASQALIDGPSKKDLREGRAAAQNIVPSSTGAAIAVTKAFTKLKGLFDGIAIRVPVPAGSIVDITFIAKKTTTTPEVNEILSKAAQDKRWKNLFTVTNEELVSSDILGSHYGCIADLKMTRVVGGNLVKVMGWYDNEMGYTYTLVDHVLKTAGTIK
ncbi:type I glyceraldehyde-3-phosphate dehydrogenase [Candidatus Nomurabacteria bacterium RIFCSPHIGHO2_01_FULL_40_12]|uniref:Type I glyceraldehyde-3-phosphate dehydrogenase n=1 Tax=Candidatus Nomurabacteria bacterium RIFCSPHIGHO2_01_FULL_40_12 TaxID=1801737 RepID=A0A1F6V1U6_9BACT|nr:MAG: type I glyceraldehyde-3-phosphate dehydrogenase [Candidatus Nomurabacteria bacterium RIFCSPHIGHO2_01_FULL_40_12]